MRSLLMKDIIIQKKMFVISLIYLAVLFFLQGIYGVYISYGFIAFVGGFFFIVTANGFDDKSKTDILLNSFPLVRRQIVSAKYLSSFLFILISAGMVAGINVLLYLTLGADRVRPIGLFELGVAAIAVMHFVSFYFPLYYRFGAQYVRVAIFLLGFAIFFAINFLDTYMEGFVSLLNIIRELSAEQMMLLAFAEAAVLMLVSWLASLRIYAKKEF
ncbi:MULTISPECIES: ABC-2 transporter permease [Aneurinibacillus]|uniref:ABC-2 transporter permease n=1 Tax=Aneurinibacillus danicus TaxID=267746 RepID=A0A511V6K6_9BACL|nr:MULTISPECIES: ABC-2 transporter permease [Aneurinibacillus]GEN34399.1 hypothetical protein ADA01nite_18590 [Aneurinibacillus danicus]